MSHTPTRQDSTGSVDPEDIPSTPQSRQAFYRKHNPSYLVLLVAYIPRTLYGFPRSVKRQRLANIRLVKDRDILSNSTMSAQKIGQGGQEGQTIALSGLTSKSTLIVEIPGMRIVDNITHGIEGVTNYLDVGRLTVLGDFSGKIHTIGRDRGQDRGVLNRRYRSKYFYKGEGTASGLTRIFQQ
mgnify:CR=1 FL=1